MTVFKTEVSSTAANAASEAAFLQALFHMLNGAGVRYAVMRNHESLPYSANGSDVDIYVIPEHVEVAKEALVRAVDETRGIIIGVMRTRHFFEAYIIGRRNEEWWGACVELYSGVLFKGAVPLVDHVILNKHIVRHNGVAIIASDIGNAIGFIKEILVHNKFRKDKPQYKASVAFLLQQQPFLFNEVFSPLGQRAPELLLRALDSASGTESARRIKAFRFSVSMGCFLRTPITFLRKRLNHELSRIGRFVNPPGAVIAILGVDGAGKSTVINSILAPMSAATHNAVFVHHLRPGLLAPLARLKGKKELAAGPFTEPHASDPSGVVGSLLRLTYLTLDYILGYWVRIRPVISKRPALVFFDRYSYDMELDPRRFRVRLSGRVAGWFAALAPKPDLILCLHGDPEVIAARKQELPLEETRRQVEALRAFASREPRAVLISTDSSIDETRDQVLQVICDFLRSKAGSGR